MTTRIPSNALSNVRTEDKIEFKCSDGTMMLEYDTETLVVWRDKISEIIPAKIPESRVTYNVSDMTVKEIKMLVMSVGPMVVCYAFGLILELTGSNSNGQLSLMEILELCTELKWKFMFADEHPCDDHVGAVSQSSFCYVYNRRCMLSNTQTNTRT